ncbi:hypothetical protein MACH10_20520 [Thalassospira tepidiphila]|nr:hypothetical protein MACH10_20520 [Thalassospira tepidiphila]
MDLENGAAWKIIDVADEPVLSPSQPGLFDAEGIMPSSIIEFGGRLLMYTIGWTVRRDVPYHNAIGVCESFDGGMTWQRVSKGPVHAQGMLEPYFCGTSEVVLSDDGRSLEMYYMSATEWRDVNGKLEPRYHIRKSTSADGILWSQDNPVVVDYLDNEEGGIARATLLSKRGSSRWMWYCYRGIDGYRNHQASAYKIGVSHKGDDGIWQRLAGQRVFSEPAREDAFDSMMECYPINHHCDGKDWLFYNGNGFGQTGIGFAERAS